MIGPGTSIEGLVERLALEAHPEGGYYRRTWVSAVRIDEDRCAGSSILFLLPAGVSSRWHRIDASELWHHAAGAPLELSTWSVGAAAVQRHRLGPDLPTGEVPQVVVDPDVWQSARSTGAWSLAVCVVVPEFRFDGFELAREEWRPPTN